MIIIDSECELDCSVCESSEYDESIVFVTGQDGDGDKYFTLCAACLHRALAVLTANKIVEQSKEPHG